MCTEQRRPCRGPIASHERHRPDAARVIYRRLTALGAVALQRARRLLGELAETDEHIAETVSGRGGRLRVSATPLWRRSVVAPAAVRFHRACPRVGLTLRTVPFSEGLRTLESGESDLHCGGVDGGQPLPAYLRREPLLRVTAGIVVRRDHPLQRAGPVFRTGDATGLHLLAEGPWFAWLPFVFFARIPELGLKPQPLTFGRRCYRTRLVARRAAEDLVPVRRFEDFVRDIALERPG